MAHPRIAAERVALEAAGLAEGVVVVHLGVGDGRQTAWLTRAVGPTGRVLAVGSAAELARAAERVAAEGLEDRWDARVGEPAELPVDGAEADLLFASGVFEPGPFAQPIGEEIGRVVRKKGRAVLVDADAGLRTLHPDVLEIRALVWRLDRLRVEAGADPEAGRKLGWVLRWAGYQQVRSQPVVWTHRDASVKALMADVVAACALLPEDERAQAVDDLREHRRFLEDRLDVWSTAGVWVATGRRK